MLVKLLCFISGVAISAGVGVISPQIYEKALVDFENIVYPIIECNAQSLADLDNRFKF
jgi:hypothetical protein